MADSQEMNIRRQFVQIPVYLRNLFREIGLPVGRYTSQPVNYNHLLNRILVSDFEQVALVTTNYDMFLERALTSVTDVEFSDLKAYVTDPQWALVKLHGSVRWVRRILRPALADIPGLDESVCLTSENIFELDRAPASLAIIGAGPIGVEMAQAMNRLGVETTLLELAPRILSREEPALADLLSGRLAEERVRIHCGVAAERAETADGLTTLYAGDASWRAERVLVATGRRPAIDDLGLDAVGVKTNRRGIVVDDRLRTNVPWLYAAGDCAGRYLFTHTAAAEAAVALRNMFYPGSSSAYAPVPWTTFTDPELAHVGLTEAEARKRLGAGKVRVHEWDLSHSDRARADGDDLGGIIAVTDSKDRIIGAHVLAPHAGDVISQFTIAIHKKMRLTPDFNEIIQVYPTYATGVQQLAADAIYGKLKEPFYRLARRVGSLLG